MVICRSSNRKLIQCFSRHSGVSWFCQEFSSTFSVQVQYLDCPHDGYHPPSGKSYQLHFPIWKFTPQLSMNFLFLRGLGGRWVGGFLGGYLLSKEPRTELDCSCLEVSFTAHTEHLVNHTNGSIYSNFFSIADMSHGCSISFNAIANKHRKHLKVLSYNLQ